MRASNVEFGAASAIAETDPVRRLASILPRPIRFLAVGGLGLITDLAVFTLIIADTPHLLAARIVSLTVATLLTWRLNRALTFDHSGRPPAEEAMRYAAVAVAAQAVSYAAFAGLVVSALAATPQLAVLIGAMAGALVSYGGQAAFAFRPAKPAATPEIPA